MGHPVECQDAILMTVREPVIVLNQELCVQAANPSFLETFQVSAEETVNRNIFEVASGQWNFPEVHRLFHFGLKGDGGPPRTFVVEHDFQRIGHKAFRLNCCRFNRDTHNLLLLAINEIGPAQTYHRLFDTAPDGLLIANAESAQIVDANLCMSNLLGADRGQLIGQLFWEVEPLSESPLGLEGWDRVRTRGAVHFSAVSFQTADGRSRQADIVANTFTEGSERFVQFNVRDITERILYDRQLRIEAKQESLAVLAGGIAHDFNNLLAVILGYTNLAMGGIPEESHFRDALSTVVTAGQRAADLTRQMITFSGNERLTLRRIDVSGLARDAALLVKDSMSPLVALELDLAPDPLFVQGDAALIKQLVSNLVTNGAEAIVEGRPGIVIVTTRRQYVAEEYIRLNAAAREMAPGSYVVLEVSDSGSGMDTETQAKIFDPFFSTRFTGRGLGLAAGFGIVKGHGGSILASNREGGGTTFEVFLPCSA